MCHQFGTLFLHLRVATDSQTRTPQPIGLVDHMFRTENHGRLFSHIWWLPKFIWGPPIPVAMEMLTDVDPSVFLQPWHWAIWPFLGDTESQLWFIVEVGEVASSDTKFVSKLQPEEMTWGLVNKSQSWGFVQHITKTSICWRWNIPSVGWCENFRTVAKPNVWPQSYSWPGMALRMRMKSLLECLASAGKSTT